MVGPAPFHGALALLAAAALGCGAARPQGEGEAERVRVTVENGNWLDVTVHAVRGGQVVRLGTVTAKTETELLLPEIVGTAGELRLLVDPVGSTAAYLSDPVPLRPGARIVLRIAPALGQSSISGY